MSRSAGPALPYANESAVVVDDSTARGVLAALNDEGCRAILRATDDGALSASEIGETCDLPLSTTYRKLNHLTDAGLLAKRIHVNSSGNHHNEYLRTVEDVFVSFDPDGAEVAVAGSRPVVEGPAFAPAAHGR